MKSLHLVEEDASDRVKWRKVLVKMVPLLYGTQDIKDTGLSNTAKPTCLHSILKYFIVVRITLKCYTLLDRGRPIEYCFSVQFEFPQHFRCFNFNYNKNLKFSIISYYFGYFTRVMHHLYWKILSYDFAHYDHKKRVWV